MSKHVVAIDVGRADAEPYADASAKLMTLYRERITGRSMTGEEAASARHVEEIDLQETRLG